MTKEKINNPENEMEKKSNDPNPLKIIIADDVKTVNLSFEQLRETRSFADAHGFMPKQFPLEHHVFIQKLLTMAEEMKTHPVVAEIIASITGIERISPNEVESKGLDPQEAQNTRIKILIGRIDLGNEEAKKLWNLSMGFMYNEKGIELCIGTNIRICGNFTIYGEAKHYKNYGRNGIELSEMFTHVEEWLNDLEGIDSINSALLERMLRIPITNHTTDEFIGRCLRNAIKKNYHKGDPFSLTMGQVNRMVSYIINNENTLEWELASMYHLYNAGTYILTHSDEMPSKFSNIKEFTHWFEDTWMLPNEMDERLTIDEDDQNDFDIRDHQSEDTSEANEVSPDNDLPE